MTLPDALRAIADRLPDPAAVRRRNKCRAQECGHVKSAHRLPLVEDGACLVCDCLGWDPMTLQEWDAVFAAPDSASAPVADEERATGEGQTSPPAASPSAPTAPEQVAARKRAPATAAGRLAPATLAASWT